MANTYKFNPERIAEMILSGDPIAIHLDKKQRAAVDAILQRTPPTARAQASQHLDETARRVDAYQTAGLDAIDAMIAASGYDPATNQPLRPGQKPEPSIASKMRITQRARQAVAQITGRPYMRAQVPTAAAAASRGNVMRMDDFRRLTPRQRLDYCKSGGRLID